MILGLGLGLIVSVFWKEYCEGWGPGVVEVGLNCPGVKR